MNSPVLGMITCKLCKKGLTVKNPKAEHVMACLFGSCFVAIWLALKHFYSGHTVSRKKKKKGRREELDVSISLVS